MKFIKALLVSGSIFFAPLQLSFARPLGGSGACPDFSALAKRLGPSVVNISVEAGASPEAPIALPNHPPKELQADQPLRSLGSGFLVSPDGYIATSNHVIADATRVIVRLADDKTEYEAKTIGKDPKTDIALLKIDYPGQLFPVDFGDSDELQVGAWVMAVGNQFQLGQTVTAGIVSAKARRVPTGNPGPYDNFIQTDASINPGSSGGPLFNSIGQVVGINTAIFSPGRSQFGGTGFNIGIGFAVPSNLVRSVVKQLKETGKVTRGLLGVLIQRVDPEIAKILTLKKPDGALVSDIVKGGPAEAAGFMRRDVIVSFNGKAVRDHDDLPLIVAETPVGSAVEVSVIRDGKPVTLKVTTAELKDMPAVVKTPEPDVTPDVAGLVVGSKQGDVGVVVQFVQPGSVADKAGLMKGDELEEAKGEALEKVENYSKVIEKANAEMSSILVLAKRAEGTRYAVMKFGRDKK